MSQIELGWPAAPLWPNFRSRVHWAKTRAVKAARAEAFYATKAARVGIPAGEGIIPVQATFYPPDRRARDYDNCGACLKSFWDGIADALGVNDSLFRPAEPIIAEPVKGGKVVVTIGGRDFDDVRIENSLKPDVIHRGGDIASSDSGGA